MKKILLIVLAIALVLSLCAGCNNSRSNDDINGGLGTVVAVGAPAEEPDDPVVEEPDDPVVEEPEDPVVEEPDGPAVEWPSVLPPYEAREGQVDSIKVRGGRTYIITITDTSESEVGVYRRGTLRNNHWEAVNFRDTKDPDNRRLRKGAYWVSLAMEAPYKTLVITLKEWHEQEVLPSVWPTDRLPQGFPEYTQGKVSGVSAYTISLQTEVDLLINFDSLSKGALEKYLNSLKDAGWKVEYIGNERFLSYSEDQQNGESWTFEKDGVYGVIETNKILEINHIQILNTTLID